MHQATATAHSSKPHSKEHTLMLSMSYTSAYLCHVCNPAATLLLLHVLPAAAATPSRGLQHTTAEDREKELQQQLKPLQLLLRMLDGSRNARSRAWTQTQPEDSTKIVSYKCQCSVQTQVPHESVTTYNSNICLALLLYVQDVLIQPDQEEQAKHTSGVKRQNHKEYVLQSSGLLLSCGLQGSAVQTAGITAVILASCSSPRPFNVPASHHVQLLFINLQST